MQSQEHSSSSSPPAAGARAFPKRRAIGLAAVAAALAVLAALPGLRRSWLDEAHAAAPPSAAPPLPVHTVRVARRSMPVLASGVGTVLPVASVTVRTRVDGQLDRVDFKEGQDVKAGQVLAHIDPRTFQAQLQQMEAQKAKDEAQLANARADLQRYSDLIREDATTRQTLETQQALVRQLSATVQNDSAQVNYARVQLGFTTIAAPIAGRIGARLVDPGNIVHAADANGLLVINQVDPIAVQFSLPESSFQAVNRALGAGRAPLSVQAIDRGTGEVLGTGDLVLLNNQIDVATGTIALKAHFANPQHKLWPGQSIDARLVLGMQADALTVPAAVVQRSQDGLFAYVVDADDTVRMQPIELGATEGGVSVVTRGLAAGDRVVSDGQYRLMPGARIVEAAASPGPATQAGAGS